MHRALVIGGSGYVGRRILDRLRPQHGVGTWNGHPSEGLVQYNAVATRLPDLLATLPGTFSHVFVLFGIVNPEQCAKDPEGTALTNVGSVVRLIEDAQAAGLTPVFVSTDYVFDGSRGGRTEDEETCPNTQYGRQKAEVERWLRGRDGPWLIARLSKVVGGETDIHSVLGQWVNDIRAGHPMRSATDQVFSPAWVDDIAQALIELAGQDARGIIHVAGEPCSRYDLNRLLVEAIREVDSAVRASVEPCSLREIPFREQRPLDTSLSTARLRAALPWRFRSMADLAGEVARAYFAPTARVR